MATEVFKLSDEDFPFVCFGTDYYSFSTAKKIINKRRIPRKELTLLRCDVHVQCTPL